METAAELAAQIPFSFTFTTHPNLPSSSQSYDASFSQPLTIQSH